MSDEEDLTFQLLRRRPAFEVLRHIYNAGYNPAVESSYLEESGWTVDELLVVLKSLDKATIDRLIHG